MKYIKDPFQFFIMSDYNFSLFGAIFGFLLVLLINVSLLKKKPLKYIDGVVLSFLFILSIGFIGAFLGGQVYGRETMFGIELLYTHPFTPIPYQVPIFPLGIVYAVFFFLLFAALYIVSMFVHIKGFIGYIGLIIFSTGILILDFFSGKTDIVSTTFPINFPQLCSVFLIAWCGYELYQVYISSNPKTYNVGTK